MRIRIRNTAAGTPSYHNKKIYNLRKYQGENMEFFSDTMQSDTGKTAVGWRNANNVCNVLPILQLLPLTIADIYEV